MSLARAQDAVGNSSMKRNWTVYAKLQKKLERLVKDFIEKKYPCFLTSSQRSKVKVGVLRPVQQPGSYWDRSSELPLVGLEPTEVTAYD